MSTVREPLPPSAYDLLAWGNVAIRTGAHTSWEFSMALYQLSRRSDRHDAALMWMARVAYREHYADAYPGGPQLLVRGWPQR